MCMCMCMCSVFPRFALQQWGLPVPPPFLEIGVGQPVCLVDHNQMSQMTAGIEKKWSSVFLVFWFFGFFGWWCYCFNHHLSCFSCCFVICCCVCCFLVLLPPSALFFFSPGCVSVFLPAHQAARSDRSSRVATRHGGD